MPSQEAGSSLHAASDQICLTGHVEIPAALLLLIPPAYWLTEHGLSTLWGEVVKHLFRPNSWYDKLEKTNGDLRAAQAAVSDQARELAVLRDLVEQLLHENDQLLAKLVELSIAFNAACPVEGQALTVAAFRQVIGSRYSVPLH